MPIQDRLMHPAFSDPRQWANVDIYNPLLEVTREPLPGEEQTTPARAFAMQHLKLDLVLDDEQQAVSGSATITLQPLNDNLLVCVLDAAEMDIRTVRLVAHEQIEDGKVQTRKELGRALTFESFREALHLELPRSYTRHDRLTIEIVYSCYPRKGLYFIQPDAAYPHKPQQIWSQGQNEDAHWWFPCHDVTNQKMTLELRATVREKFFALSNGRLVSISANAAARTKTYHWSQAQPLPPYLVSIVVGEYEKLTAQHGALPVESYVYRGQRAAGERLFAHTPAMIAFFEQRFGVPYPYDKYAQVVVDEFLFGAMENTSASTFTDRCLLDERATLDVNYDDIVAHELAHHWFGDLVTCKDWTQIWVNESFATYSEYLWREHTEGSEEARFVLQQDWLTYLREDLTSHRRPLNFTRYRFSEELMDRHAYEKGACILHMLRWVLGDAAFFRSWQFYLQANAHGTGDGYALQAAIEAATGQNLYWFFDQWVAKAGYPELEVSYEWQREHGQLVLRVKQVQELSAEVPVFRFPLEIELVTAGDPTPQGEPAPQRTTYQVWLHKAEQEFYFPCVAKPQLVVFDKHDRLFKLLRFEKSEQELIAQLELDEGLLGRMRAACELGAHKTLASVTALHSKLTSADHVGVRAAAALALGEIGTPAAQDALIIAYRTSEQPAVRRACVYALGLFTDEASYALLANALEKDESYFVAVTAARALAQRGGERAFADLAKALERDSSWQSVVGAAVLHGWAQAKELRAIPLALRASNYGNAVPLRLAAIATLGTLGKQLRETATRQQATHNEPTIPAERITDALTELLKDRNLRARVAAVRALGKVGDPRALSSLRAAQQRECLDQLKAALLDSIAALEKKAG